MVTIMPYDDEIYDSLARLHLSDNKQKEEIAFLKMHVESLTSLVRIMMGTQEALIKAGQTHRQLIQELSKPRLDDFSELN